MQYRAQFDAGTLSRFGGRDHPLYMGIALLVAIEASVSIGLVTTYLYLFARAPAWPPDSDPPDLLWPTLNLALLLSSAGTMWWAGKGIDRSNQTQLVLGVGASTLLAAIGLVLRALQFDQLDPKWSDNAYGSIVWTITGFHFMHVASAVAGTAVVTLLAWLGYFTRERQLGVIVDTLYWYFVAFVWVPFYLLLYWLPRASSPGSS